MLLIVPIITSLFIGIIILTIILQVYTGDDIRKHHREAATKFIKISCINSNTFEYKLKTKGSLIKLSNQKSQIIKL